MNYVDKKREEIKKNILSSYLDPNFEAAVDFLEKGKKASIGEIREWKGGKQQKQADGSWKEVPSGKSNFSSKLKPGDEGEFKSHEGEEFSYRVYSDGGVKVESHNVRKDFKTTAEAEAFIAKEKGQSAGKPKEEKKTPYKQKYISADKVKPGDVAEDYDGNPGKITKVSKNLHDFKKLEGYESLRDEVGMDGKQVFVSFKSKDGDEAVYTYGDGGVNAIPQNDDDHVSRT